MLRIGSGGGSGRLLACGRRGRRGGRGCHRFIAVQLHTAAAGLAGELRHERADVAAAGDQLQDLLLALLGLLQSLLLLGELLTQQGDPGLLLLEISQFLLIAGELLHRRHEQQCRGSDGHNTAQGNGSPQQDQLPRNPGWGSSLKVRHGRTPVRTRSLRRASMPSAPRRRSTLS